MCSDIEGPDKALPPQESEKRCKRTAAKKKRTGEILSIFGSFFFWGRGGLADYRVFVCGVRSCFVNSLQRRELSTNSF